MRIGIPKEIKPLEGRVGLVPEACVELLRAGHSIVIERGAGLQSGFADEDYRQIGVSLADEAATVYAESDLIIR